MACNCHTHPDRQRTTLFPTITYLLFAPNSIAAACRAYNRGDSATLAFIAFEYSSFLLLELSCYLFQRLPPHEKSRLRCFLRFAIWLLFSGIMFGISAYCGPLFHQPTPCYTLYGFSVFGSVLLFYVYVIWDGTSGCVEECGEGEGKSSECGKMRGNDEHDYDFVLEKV